MPLFALAGQGKTKQTHQRSQNGDEQTQKREIGKQARATTEDLSLWQMTQLLTKKRDTGKIPPYRKRNNNRSGRKTRSICTFDTKLIQ